MACASSERTRNDFSGSECCPGRCAPLDCLAEKNRACSCGCWLMVVVTASAFFSSSLCLQQSPTQGQLAWASRIVPAGMVWSTFCCPSPWSRADLLFPVRRVVWLRRALVWELGKEETYEGAGGWGGSSLIPQCVDGLGVLTKSCICIPRIQRSVVGVLGLKCK